jgi:hypothetical protein
LEFSWIASDDQLQQADAVRVVKNKGVIRVLERSLNAPYVVGSSSYIDIFVLGVLD